MSGDLEIPILGCPAILGIFWKIEAPGPMDPQKQVRNSKEVERSSGNEEGGVILERCGGTLNTILEDDI